MRHHNWLESGMEINLLKKTSFQIIIPTLVQLLLFAPSFSQTDNGTNTTAAKSPDKVKDILTGNTAEDRQYELRKKKFLDQTVSDITDSTMASGLIFEMSTNRGMPFLLDSEGLKGFHPGSNDPIGDELRRRQNDIPPTVSLNDAIRNLVQSLRKDKPTPKDSTLPVPTDNEIDVLKVLWVEGGATASDIYAKLDTSTAIFAEELQEVLKTMVDRGFVDRKQISPAHEFNLFGIAQIEISAKNRKNKVYLYWPIVTKQALFTYLDAKRYLALVSAQSSTDYDIKNNRYASNYQKYLQNKLHRMFE